MAHNGSLIPVEGKRHHGPGLVPGRHLRLGLHRLGQPEGDRLLRARPARGHGAGGGGSWSAYYYNGYIYSSDIEKGLDVLEINDPRTNRAK